jgi:hypothetical protein
MKDMLVSLGVVGVCLAFCWSAAFAGVELLKAVGL